MIDGGKSKTTYQEQTLLELAAQEHARQAFRERLLVAVVFLIATALIVGVIFAIHALWQSVGG